MPDQLYQHAKNIHQAIAEDDQQVLKSKSLDPSPFQKIGPMPKWWFYKCSISCDKSDKSDMQKYWVISAKILSGKGHKMTQTVKTHINIKCSLKPEVT